MKRLKWESTEWGWVAKTRSVTLELAQSASFAKRFTGYFLVGSSMIEREEFTAKTSQGAKRAAVQWAKRVVRELAKEWE